MGTHGKHLLSSYWVRVPLNIVILALFGVLSWKFYYDGLVDDIILIFLYATPIVPAAYTVLVKTGIIWDTDRHESYMSVYVRNLLMMFIVGTFCLSFFVGLFSITAVFVQSAIDMPWAKLGILGSALCGGVCIIGIVSQKNWLLEIREDGEMLTDFLGVRALIGCIIIGLSVVGVVDYYITAGSFIGTLFALFFMPLLLTIGIMRGITFFLDPKVQVACKSLGITRPLWSDAPSLWGYLSDTAGFVWSVIRTVFINHEALEFVLRYGCSAELARYLVVWNHQFQQRSRIEHRASRLCSSLTHCQRRLRSLEGKRFERASGVPAQPLRL